MRVYLDESGCLGFKFSKPYLHGGSSKFLCLAFLFVSKQSYKEPASIITDLYKKYCWKNEKKAASASPKQKLEFANHVAGLMTNHPSVKIDCIVVKKENVQQHIITDPNKLYNYMCRLVICDYVKNEQEFEFIPDKRSIKVESGNSLSDYLQTHLWFEEHSNVKLFNDPQESYRNHNLQFVDWIAHIIWSHYENGPSNASIEIFKRIRIRNLFF